MRAHRAGACAVGRPWQSIHEEMIRDSARTETYQAGIMANRSLLEGRVVLDVGCGTGILSLFCCAAGARKVYAVDASDIAKQARLVVAANGMAERIEIIQSRIEDLELPEKVDVIVSEWMGYFLLYESMLDSVLLARDRWLRPGGIMLPSHARIYIAPFTDDQYYHNRISAWSDVYGWDFSALM